MFVITVIPLARGVFKENLTYFSGKTVSVGDVVKVDVRKRRILGLVVKTVPLSSAKGDVKTADFNLRKIIEAKGASVFRPEFLQSAIATGEYSATLPGDALAFLIPEIFKSEYDKISLRETESPAIAKPERNIKSEKLLFQESFEERLSFYKTLIRGSFAEKKSVFIVLPTSSDIAYFAEKLAKGIGQFSFCFHSGMRKNALLADMQKSLETEHPVLVLATAPYLAIPRQDIGVIIIERENSSGYKTLNRPFLDLRIFAEIFASKIGARLILADTLLRYESLARKEENFSLIRPINWRHKSNADLRILPRVKNEKRKFKVLSDEVVPDIESALALGENVFIFALRKGLATETVCRDCGETLTCEDCAAPLTLYPLSDGKRMFVCNRCNREKSAQTSCPNCNSWNLEPLGVGTDRVFEEARKLFPKAHLFKIDKESVKSDKEAAKIAGEFAKSRGAILVGTQMAIPYLKAPVKLTIAASFDSLWSIPNFKMSEKVIGILLALLSKTAETLLVQTKNSAEPALQAFLSGNLSGFIKKELRTRKNMGYPPYKRFIKITHLGRQSEVESVRSFLKTFFKDYAPLVFHGLVPKIRNQYITNALIKLDTKDWSPSECVEDGRVDKELLKKLLSLPPNFYINVDPENLL